jgi:hypothetical protein
MFVYGGINGYCKRCFATKSPRREWGKVHTALLAIFQSSKGLGLVDVQRDNKFFVSEINIYFKRCLDYNCCISGCKNFLDVIFDFLF